MLPSENQILDGSMTNVCSQMNTICCFPLDVQGTFWSCWCSAVSSESDYQETDSFALLPGTRYTVFTWAWSGQRSLPSREAELRIFDEVGYTGFNHVKNNGNSRWQSSRGFCGLSAERSDRDL